MAQKGYFCHQRQKNIQFWNRKHGQKWSTLYQTMYFDTDLQMKLVYSGFVIILWQFLAFYGPKMLLLPLVAQNTQFWNSKHGKKKWSKLYQTICFDTALQMNIVSSELVIILWQFLALMGEKWLFFPPEAQNTQFWNSKHGQIEANSTRPCS